jgi:GntR family transcriptional regulator, transcriptional repressor for pyruvate dehydrogenase complex
MSSASMSLSPISRSKLAQTVAEQLIAEIRDKDLRPGTRIPSERDLMAAFGVGRSTVREAINGMAMIGVLEIRHGQGAFVANATAGEALPNAIATALARGVTHDLFEARQLVEAHTARLAAQRRTESDVHELEQVLVDHERAIELGAPAVEPAVRFHVRLAEAAHSEVLASFVCSFVEILTEHGHALEATPGYREWEIEQHRHLFEPIRDGDPDLAAERMHAHLDAVVPHHERVRAL